MLTASPISLKVKFTTIPICGKGRIALNATTRFHQDIRQQLKTVAKPALLTPTTFRHNRDYIRVKLQESGRPPS